MDDTSVLGENHQPVTMSLTNPIHDEDDPVELILNPNKKDSLQ